MLSVHRFKTLFDRWLSFQLSEIDTQLTTIVKEGNVAQIILSYVGFTSSDLPTLLWKYDVSAFKGIVTSSGVREQWIETYLSGGSCILLAKQLVLFYYLKETGVLPLQDVWPDPAIFYNLPSLPSEFDAWESFLHPARKCARFLLYKRQQALASTILILWDSMTVAYEDHDQALALETPHIDWERICLSEAKLPRHCKIMLEEIRRDISPEITKARKRRRELELEELQESETLKTHENTERELQKLEEADEDRKQKEKHALQAHKLAYYRQQKFNQMILRNLQIRRQLVKVLDNIERRQAEEDSDEQYSGGEQPDEVEELVEVE